MKIINMYKTWNGDDCLAYVLIAQLISEKYDKLVVKLNLKDENEQIVEKVETILTNSNHSESNMFRVGHVNIKNIKNFVKVGIESVAFLNDLKEEIAIDKDNICIDEKLIVENEDKEIFVVLE